MAHRRQTMLIIEFSLTVFRDSSNHGIFPRMLSIQLCSLSPMSCNHALLASRKVGIIMDFFLYALPGP